MKYKDYYKILKVDKNSSQEDIKKSYRKLAKKFHPDINPGSKQAEEQFKDINEAYEVLGDPEKRTKYNNFGNQTNFQNGYDFDPSQYGSRNNVRYEHRTNGSGSEYSDFFNMFFGGSGIDVDSLFRDTRGSRQTTGFYHQFPQNGKNLEAEIEITVQEGFTGVEKKISLKRNNAKKSLAFKIPKGVKNGERIKLREQGEEGTDGGRNGDLFLTIRIKPDNRFSIDGNDITMSLDILPWDAALGTEVTVEGLDGKLLVRIPSKIQTGNKIRLAGKGYIDKSGKRGSLYIRVSIVNPKNISHEMKELYKKLKNCSES